MDTVYNIFSIKTTEFDAGQRDPFGFDDFSEKLGAKYLPFSGTVRKPIYFLFIEYVNWLWQNKRLNIKKKEEARLRLEKLLVLSWKERSDTLTGKHILGNSKKKINPFRGNDGNWIIQTCFKIYSASVTKVISNTKFIDRYIQDNLGEEKTLNDFLINDGLLDKKNDILLINTLQKLAKKKYSLFSGEHQLSIKYKRMFLNYLKNAILNTNKDYYYDIQIFFNETKNLEDRLYKKTILNEKNYPFKALNNWFTAVINAVDKEINNENSKTNWNKADALYLKIPEKYRRELKLRPEPRCWFERTGNSYLAKQGKDFDEDGWNALLRRAQEENFYDFKHNALISLLKETY